MIGSGVTGRLLAAVLGLSGALSLGLAPAQAAKAKHAKVPAKPASTHPVIKDCADCPEMIMIPAGSFTMGSPATEKFRGNETAHKVTIAAFAASEFEITFAQWDACVRGGGCDGYRPGDQGWGRGRRPVIFVNWVDATAYAQWLSKKTGKHYRLLSESEWEYAARGGTQTAFSFGPILSAKDANFDSSSKSELNPKAKALKRTLPVGSFAANAFGLHDMHGNVWEWVDDCWNDDYGPNTPSDGKPAMGGDCAGRIVRGGSWEDYAGDVRAATRTGNETEERSWTDGIRVARDP